MVRLAWLGNQYISVLYVQPKRPPPKRSQFDHLTRAGTALRLGVPERGLKDFERSGRCWKILERRG